MAEKGTLIGINLKTEEDLTEEKIEILKKADVVFAHRKMNDVNGALDLANTVLEQRKDYKKLMLVTPVFPSDPSEESLKNSWDMAGTILDHYLKTGRDVVFLTSINPPKTDLNFVEERLGETYEIKKIE